MDRTESKRIVGRVRVAAGRLTEVVRKRPGRAVLLGVAAVAALILVFRAIPDRVQTVSPERREIVETLVTTGRVRTVSRAQVGAPLVGTVTRVAVREGDRVAAGALLVALDDAEARASVAEARARLTAAEAALRRLTTVELPGAAADLEAAELEARQLSRDSERLRDLYEAGGLSRQELEVAVRTAEAAQARLERARNSVASFAAGGADRRSAEAGVAQARESVGAALARLENTRLRAPAAGTVLMRDVEPGDAVQPGRALLEIALDGPTELLIFPDERAVAALRVGQAAVASADAFPDDRFDATVSRIAPVVDPDQGTIEVRLSVPSPPSYLLPDMTVSVNVEVARRAEALTLPIQAVRAPLSDTAWVLVARDGRAIRAPVELGIRDDRYVEVTGGVETDDRVVAARAGTVAPGDRIRPRRDRDGGG